jgi:hypothetical protein
MSTTLADICVDGANLRVVDANRIDALERELGTVMPPGYREYASRLGDGTLNGGIRFFLPNDVLEWTSDLRSAREAQYWHWEELEAFGEADVVRAIQVGESDGEDRLVFLPEAPHVMYWLPLDRDYIEVISQTGLFGAIDWLCGEGAAFRDRIGTSERFFDPVDHRPPRMPVDTRLGATLTRIKSDLGLSGKKYLGRMMKELKLRSPKSMGNEASQLALSVLDESAAVPRARDAGPLECVNRASHWQARGDSEAAAAWLVRALEVDPEDRHGAALELAHVDPAAARRRAAGKRGTKRSTKKDAKEEANLELCMTLEKTISGAVIRESAQSGRGIGLVFRVEGQERAQSDIAIVGPSEIVDAVGSPVALGPEDRVHVVHRLALDESELATWRSLLEARGIVQSFPQLAREIRTLRDNELDAKFLWRWMGSSIVKGSLAKLEARGWRKGDWGRQKPIDAHHFFEIKTEGSKFREVTITDGRVPVQRTFRSCGAIANSELLLDLELLGLAAAF